MSPHPEKHAVSLALAGLVLVAGCSEPASERSADQVAQRAVENRNFGIHCTSSYFGGWLPALSDGWTICGGLSSRLDDEATHEFTYNLYQKFVELPFIDHGKRLRRRDSRGDRRSRRRRLARGCPDRFGSVTQAPAVLTEIERSHPGENMIG